MLKPANYITFEFQYLHPEQNTGTNEWGIQYVIRGIEHQWSSPIFSAGKGNNGIVYLDSDDIGNKIADFINRYAGGHPGGILFIGFNITHNGESFRRIQCTPILIKRIELVLDKNTDLHDGKIHMYDKNGHIQYV